MSVIISSGIVVVRREPDGWKYLLLRAYKNWDFPKGEVEPGEDPLETAKREVTEETGISDLSFRWGHGHKETPPYRGGKKIARYYAAETGTETVILPVNPEIGRPEHVEHRWCSSEELVRLAPERLSGVVEWAIGVVQGDG
jgi:8-oxo-dGTP pyrophosphatase MutT (NUDIX family)